MSREDSLKQSGFQEPFDGSIVEVPHGWCGGGVEAFGGGLQGRIWCTWSGNEEQNTWEYQVLYNLTDRSVALHKFEYKPDLGRYEEVEDVKTVEADRLFDYRLGKKALELMEYTNEHLPSKPPGEAGDKTAYGGSSAVVSKMEQDVEEVAENYGRDISLVNEFEDVDELPLIRLKATYNSLNVVDEVAGVLQGMGYEVAYVDFDEEYVAFCVRSNIEQVPYEMLDVLYECLDSWEIVPDEEMSAVKLQDGYEITVPFERPLFYDMVCSKEHEPLTYMRDGVVVNFTGTHDDDLLLTISHKA